MTDKADQIWREKNRTWREKRIKELSKAGNNIKEIARILMISERTVSSCFSRHKLDKFDEEFEVYVTVRPKAKNRKLNYEEINSKIDGGFAPDYAQWKNGTTDKPLFQGN